MEIVFPQPALPQPVTNTKQYILSHRWYCDNRVTVSSYSCFRLQERSSKGMWKDVSIARKPKADGDLVLGLVESLLYTKRKILSLNIWANTVGCVDRNTVGCADTNTCHLNAGLFSLVEAKPSLIVAHICQYWLFTGTLSKSMDTGLKERMVITFKFRRGYWMFLMQKWQLGKRHAQ